MTLLVIDLPGIGSSILQLKYVTGECCLVLILLHMGQGIQEWTK